MDTHWQLPLVLRLEWRITALGMNAALAGLLVMLASAFGLLEMDGFWLLWPVATGLMCCLTWRRMGRELAPLFWRI